MATAFAVDQCAWPLSIDISGVFWNWQGPGNNLTEFARTPQAVFCGLLEALGGGLKTLGSFLKAIEGYLEQLGGAMDAKMSQDSAKIAPKETSSENYRSD